MKKDRSASPPKYLIFFKARDADALTAAFSEYTQKKVKKADRSERPSVLEKLSHFKELINKCGCGQDKAEGVGTMKQLNMKKLVLLNLPYFLLGLFATNLGEAWRLAVGADASAKTALVFSPPCRWRWGVGGPACTQLDSGCGSVLRRWPAAGGVPERQERQEVPPQCGVWFGPLGHPLTTIAPYIDPVFQNNVILTQTERLTMSQPPQEPQVCPQQKRAGHRRFRQRQDPLLAQGPT